VLETEEREWFKQLKKSTTQSKSALGESELSVDATVGSAGTGHDMGGDLTVGNIFVDDSSNVALSRSRILLNREGQASLEGFPLWVARRAVKRKVVPMKQLGDFLRICSPRMHRRKDN
jgi:hypothetical protein